MKTITTEELTTVTGGTSSNDAVTSQLTALQGSIKDLAAAKPASSTDSMMLPMMMMAMRPQQAAPTVVTAGAPAAAPVVNINTRVRRW